jgi:hypothetical protein
MYGVLVGYHEGKRKHTDLGIILKQILDKLITSVWTVSSDVLFVNDSSDPIKYEEFYD